MLYLSGEIMEFVKSFLNEDFELKMLGVNVAGQFDFRSK